MWGIIPAAGNGSRIQPLGFSKELLPIGGTGNGETHTLQPAINHIIERLIVGGATRLCVVVSPEKADIMKYIAARRLPVDTCYVYQPEPIGLPDAIFRAVPFVREDEIVMIGLPDTVWFPEDGYRQLDDDVPSLLMFPVRQPELFDAVLLDRDECVTEVQVKVPRPDSSWIWGAIKLPGAVYHSLHDLWVRRGRVDVQVGTLINAYIAEGGVVKGVRRGRLYVDVGTVSGYVDALRTLSEGDLLTV
jgi:glucose-1-phosphate thymidylyltransferase